MIESNETEKNVKINRNSDFYWRNMFAIAPAMHSASTQFTKLDWREEEKKHAHTNTPSDKKAKETNNNN